MLQHRTLFPPAGVPPLSNHGPIAADIDLAAPGKRLGYLRLPHSVHRSAYGYIPIPIGVIANGAGPKTVVMAGNHGDEYEGQVIVSTLLRTLEPKDVRGTLILLPMANFPAAEAGLRTSPLDQGNLNRAFAQDYPPGPTRHIAQYLEQSLFQGIDLLLDLHSGGSSLCYLPSALGSWPEEAGQKALMERLIAALAIPYTLMFSPDRAGPYASSAAQRNGGLALTLEIAGGGSITPSALQAAEAGVLRCLRELGLYQGVTTPPGRPTTMMTVESQHYLYADEPGLFEPLAGLGDSVRAGQPAARIHRPETPGRAPLELAFPADGKVICLRVPARVIRGDCLLHLAAPA
jgi:predicted deacylase